MIDLIHTLSFTTAVFAGTSIAASVMWFIHKDSAKFWQETAFEQMERSSRLQAQVVGLEVELDELIARLDA